MKALRNAEYPHDHDDRRAWKALLKDPRHQASWRAAYEGQDSRADTMGRVHAALEGDESSVVLKRQPEGAL
jgi:hypothetical protein